MRKFDAFQWQYNKSNIDTGCGAARRGAWHCKHTAHIHTQKRPTRANEKRQPKSGKLGKKCTRRTKQTICQKTWQKQLQLQDGHGRRGLWGPGDWGIEWCMAPQQSC